MAERDPGKVLLGTLPSKCVRLLDEIAQSLSTGFQPLDCHGFGFAWWLRRHGMHISTAIRGMRARCTLRFHERWRCSRTIPPET